MIDDDLTGAIMAGGKSSRMGQNKSFVGLKGKMMIEHVRDTVSLITANQIIITNTPAVYQHLQLPMYADIYPDLGPLAGIYTAVFHAQTSHTLIVATDMPWLNIDLLKYLSQLKNEADIVVPRWHKFPEPLHAIYSRSVLPPIKANLEAKTLKITRFFENVSVRYVEKEEIERFDKSGRSFSNINTPEELAAAKKILKNRE